MAGFGVPFSTLLVTMGRIGDIKGRRKILYMGIIGFALASLGVGLATNATWLISMRILQGFFAAAIYPTGLSITSASFSETQRTRALGIYSSIIGIGMAMGPVFGSLVVTLSNWRWVFFINIPIIIISLLICLPLIPESRYPEKLKVDWLGAISLVIFLATLTLAISESAYHGWFSGFTIGLLIMALVALLSFIWVEKNTKSPLLPLKLFLNNGFIIGSIVAFVAISLAWPILFIMPLYLHHQFHLTTGIVGIVLLPMTIMTIIFPGIGGYLLDKTNRSVQTAHIPILLVLVSLFLFTFFHGHSSLWFVMIAFVIFGMGWGFGNGLAIPLALSHLKESHDHGVVSGGGVTLFNLLAVICLACYTMLFHHGEQVLNFIYGMKLANCALLVIVTFIWLMLLGLLHYTKQ